MKSFFFIFLFPFCIVSQAFSQQNEPITSHLKEHVQFLTSPELRGRGIDNGGADLAAEYILSAFKDFGLSGDGYSLDSIYLQNFVVNKYSSITPESFIQIGEKQFCSSLDFVSMSFRGSHNPHILNGFHHFKLKKTNDLIFCIFLNVDSVYYQGNVKALKSKSEFNSASKAMLEYELFVKNNPIFVLNPQSDSTIFDMVVSPALGKELDKIEENEDVTLFFKREVSSINCKNILGFLPAAESNSDSAIVITAHYDHLGEINGNLYPWANDNASGVAVMLELARVASEAIDNGWEPTVKLIFIAFSAEEAGLLGSSFFTNNQPFDLSKIKYVINLDMVGGNAINSALEPEKLFLYHSSGISKEVINTLIEQSEKHRNLTFDLNGKVKYLKASDQASFIKKGIPSIFIFSGIDKNCHKPSDTLDFLSFEKMTDLTLVLEAFIKK